MPPARPRDSVETSRSDFSGVIAKIEARAKFHKQQEIKHAAKRTKTSIDKQNGTHQTQSSDVQNGQDAATNGATEADAGAPQTDWNSMSIPTLHTYRSSYQIQIPSGYTQPHAELLYNSSKTGLRAPSVVRARRQERELQARRKKRAQLNGNGASKAAKRNDKDKASDRSGDTSKQKGKGTPTVIDGDAIAQSIEPITSPTLQSLSSSSDHTASLLNSINPDTTLVGRSSPTFLALMIRKHFNAQQLNEADTIAKFMYVAKQHGHGATHPTTSSSSMTGGTPSRSTLPVSVEGSDGDGSGWIMGSMGRQVRMNDSGGTGAFRLRFRPS